MPEHKPQMDTPRGDEYERDLHPDPMAGQNIGIPEAGGRATRTAYDVKSVHRGLRDFPDDELKAIPVLGDGTALQQGATYVNLRDPRRGEITATGGMRAGRDDAYVPKDRVPYPTWNRLLGVDDPERTGGDPYG